ncbi:MAG TPA: amidohydrolase [Pyrinomonadaceae bacterium]|jgi:Predicted metal-dependent hydrolase with the TIM-barrel fold|nr:amidohydrolase [Pyrinomonadaceae bacterium]
MTLPTHADKSTTAPDLIIVNAVIHTMDPNQPTAEAVAIYGNRIMAVGSTKEIRKLAATNTRVIDAKKRLVLPGFNDAHTHFMSGGFQLSSVDLRSSNSPQEFAERIRTFAEKLPKGRWIKGGDWDHERWPDAKLPTKELIDSFTPDTPVFVSRLDGHMALANSLALRLAGVTRQTLDPPGGVIVRDPKTGEPTGILKDAAQNFVWKVISPSSFEEKLAAARAATDYAASLGVTSIQDMSAGVDVGVYQTLLDRGELKTRIYAVSPLPAWERLARTGVRAHFGSEMLRVGGLKGFADGSLGSTTALFYEPYRDDSGTSGIAGDEMYPEGAMLARVRDADKAGLQTMIHAIGDRANDLILTIFEQVERENGDRDRRFRIEHAQHLRPQDISRFSRDKVIASMQPYHAIDDGRWAEKRIGKERAKTTYAFRSLLDSGATLAFGTDWTVAPLNPVLTVYAAVTRRTLDGKNSKGWIPEQKISVEEAVRAYTVGSAYAEFQETVKGNISAGKLADLVILSRDIFKIDPKEIENVKVNFTVVDGRVVYEERE